MVYKTSRETQEKKDIKKKHIVNCAIKVFAANGYHGTTVKNVVDKAEVSVGTFYFYFKNKEDLFETLYEEVTDKLYETICDSLSNINIEVDTGLSKAITFFLMAIESNEPLARIMLIEAIGLNPKFEVKRAMVTNKLINYAAEHFNKMLNNSMIDVPDAGISAMAFIGTIYIIVMEWLQSKDSKKLTDYSYSLIVYNLQAMRINYNEEKIRKAIEEMMDSEFLKA